MLGLAQNLSTSTQSAAIPLSGSIPYETLEVSTLAAGNLDSTSFTANGSFSGGVNVFAYIELSLDSGFNNSILLWAGATSPFYINLSSLTVGETFYYRAVVEDAITGRVTGSSISVDLVGPPDRVASPVIPTLVYASGFSPGSSLTNTDYWVRGSQFSTEELEVLASVSDDQSPAVQKTNVLKAQAKYYPHASIDSLGIKLPSSSYSSDTINTLTIEPSTDYRLQFNMYLPDTNETVTAGKFFAIGPIPFDAFQSLASDYTSSDVGSWKTIVKEFTTPAVLNSEADPDLFIYAADDDSSEANDIFYVSDVLIQKI